MSRDPRYVYHYLVFRKSLLFVALLGLAFPSVGSAATHKQVQAAISWQLPINQCKKPTLRGYDYEALIAGGYISHAPTNISSETSAGGPAIFDLDYYQIERFERKQRRWEACVGRYKKKLLQDFKTLRDSAQYGLSKTQAETILAKLAQIQTVLMSPDGLPKPD